MKYRLVIFDSDGTLCNTLPRAQELFNQLADKHGFRRVEPHESEQFRDLSGREMFAALRIPLWKVPRIVTDMRALMRDHIHEFHPFDGVRDELRRLHDAGLTLGVVSSNSTENVRRILGPTTASVIAHYACGASIFGKAPKLKSVLRASGIKASESIYVGDELRDGEAAAKVGMRFGAVAWGQHRLELLEQHRPAELFRSVADLGAALLK